MEEESGHNLDNLDKRTLQGSIGSSVLAETLTVLREESNNSSLESESTQESLSE